MGRVHQTVCVCLITHWVGLSPPASLLEAAYPWGVAAEAEFQVQRWVSPPLRAGPAGPPQTEDCDALLPPRPQPLPSQHSLLGVGAASVGPEDDLSHPRDPQRGRGGPAAHVGCPPPGTPLSSQLLRPGISPCGRGGVSLWTLVAPLPRWRMEQSTSWRPSTPSRSTRGWLTSRAAQTPGETPGMGRRGGGA